MPKKLKKKTGVARIIWIACLTVFFGSVAIIAVFYYSFGDVLIGDAVRRVVERTVGYNVSLSGIHLVSPGRVSVQGMDLVIGSTVFSSGPATIDFRLGIKSPLTIRKVTITDPSVFVDISAKGGGGGERMVQRIMDMDIVVTGGNFVVADGAARYVITGVEMAYEHRIVGATFTATGSALTEGEGDGAILDGPFSASVRVSGTYPDVSVKGTVTAGGAGFRIGKYLLSGKRLNARVRLSRDVMEVTDAAINGLSIAEDGSGLAFDGVAATGGIRNEAGGPFTLSDVKLSIPRFGELSLDLLVEKNKKWKVTIDSKSVMLSSENLRRLGSHVPGLFKGWTIQGRARTGLTVGTTDTGDGSIAGSLDLVLINAGFSSPDSLYIGQGISATALVQFRDDIRRGMLFDGNLAAHDFGLLLAGFFINFEKRRITVAASGNLTGSGALRDLDCTVSVPAAVSAHVSGDVDFAPDDPRGSLSCRVKAEDMGAAFDLFFRNYFRNRVAWLYGGVISGSLDWHGNINGNLSTPRVSGSLSVTGSTLDFPDVDTKIEGISASMPFSLDLSEKGKGKPAHRFSPAEFGRITVSRAVVGGVEIGGMTVSPALAENALTLKDDLALSASGGTVTIRGFAADNILSENRTVNASLSIKRVDLVGIFPKEKSVNLKGELSGEISEIRVAEKKLFTSGILTAKIFNGEVSIGRIWGQDIFDPSRRLGCDVTFADIDLGALTQTIDVGRVTGIAEGRISDLVYSYGGPERFEFDIRTVDKRGVQKRVSVDFVDKLTFLGSGSTLFSGVLRGGIKQFIHDYKYSKIGIHLELKDDYFTLRGTIHEGDTEYFIKRSGLTGINVINQTPENRIRFDDMMLRLERINVKNTDDIRIETK